MTWRDIKHSLRDFATEFRRVKYGLVGVALFVLFFLLIVCEPWITAFPEASKRWRDITYWKDNPKNAAPVWVNWFTGRDRAPQALLDDPVVKTITTQGSRTYQARFRYRNAYHSPPHDIFLRARAKGVLNVRIQVVRPDKRRVDLFSRVYSYGSEQPLRVSIKKEGAGSILEFAKRFEPYPSGIAAEMMQPIEVLFARTSAEMIEHPVALQGDYEILVTALLVGGGTRLAEPELLVTGSVFGLLGTDSSGRDIWSGVIAGTKWALLIGLLTAAISVLIGVFYGVVSAYFGGWLDAILMRIYDVFVSIPLLPILIVFSAIFKPTIWILILAMCVFFWVGPVRTVRSMGMQLREETYVEAAHALGSSGWRIIFRHMIPQLIPYAFASMALQVPSAIVFEASISLIGLGDASIATWGQILHDAMQSGAVLQGLWWWVVPPGLFIAVMGMTFAFVGFAMDTILNPKLRTR